MSATCSDCYLTLSVANVVLCSKHAQVDALVEALARLVADVQDYPAWERPCFAVDEANKALAAVRSGKEKK